MINAKLIYNTVLNDERVKAVAKTVLDAYPETITKFPCVVYLDASQSDKEFADNLPTVDSLGVEVHIFTKTVGNYKTTTEIGIVIANVMKENEFICTSNREVPDTEDNIKHRVMYFIRDVYSL